MSDLDHLSAASLNDHDFVSRSPGLRRRKLLHLFSRKFWIHVHETLCHIRVLKLFNFHPLGYYVGKRLLLRFFCNASHLSGVQYFGEGFCECDQVVSNHRGSRIPSSWLVLLLPTFTCLGHDCQDRFESKERMHAQTELSLYSRPKEWYGVESEPVSTLRVNLPHKKDDHHKDIAFSMPLL